MQSKLITAIKLYAGQFGQILNRLNNGWLITTCNFTQEAGVGEEVDAGFMMTNGATTRFSYGEQ